MADRDVAGFSRLDRQREADELALQRVGRVRLGVDRDDALILRASDPCAELGRGSDDLVGRAIDRRARLLCPRGGEVSRAPCLVARPSARAAREQGPLQRGTRLPPARLLLAPKAPRPGRPATPRGRRSAGPARSTPMSTPQISATRRVSVVSSIALQNEIEPLAVELRRRERLERRLDRHVPIQGDELLRHPDELDGVGIGQRFAALGLFDLARAREQRLEVAIFGDELSGGLEPDAGRARHVVGRIAGERLDVDHPVRADARNIP